MDNEILIIGGGLGGLCLAQGLLKAGLPFRVFDRDASADWRPQGYRLRINSDGANALRDMLPSELWERFQKTCCIAEIGETDINAADGTIIASRAMKPKGPGPKPYTCDRTVLRNILLSGLSEKISYGKELLHYTVSEVPGGHVVAYFKDGTTATGCFLVGADGAASVTRRQLLPTHVPLDTEGMCIYGKTPITKELLERFPARAMRWMTLVLDRTPVTQTLDVDDAAVTLLLEPIRFPKRTSNDSDNDKDEADRQSDIVLPDDYMYWVLVARKHVFDLPADVPFSTYSGDEIADISLRIADCWDPSLRSILHLQDRRQSSLLRILSADLDMAPWTPSDKVTVIGDACHVMSPCGGVGAATALADGASLARTIATEGISAESIGQFERGMRELAGANIRRSYFGGRQMFGQKPFDRCAPYTEGR
ncbi:cercosporin toxin biosynthesis protein [Xylariaceae sp. AK1471]|nr:cercosporin toxin biosynthesis protein [Xylariaceae sp. AK1471]